MEPQRDVYEPLNGLRGVAAIAVVLFHASEIMQTQIAPRGYLAVDLFFVLSGFVIAHAYDRKFAAGLGPFRFFWLRVKRFYPLYLAGMLLGTVVMAIDVFRPPSPMTPVQFAGTFVAGLLFLPVPWRDLYPLNVPAWSLLCELLINLVYGLLWKRTAALALLAACSWALLWLPQIQDANLLTGMLRAGFSFPVGVFIYRFRPRVPKLPGWPTIALLAAVLLSSFPDMLAITVIFPLGIALLARCDNGFGFERLGRLSFPLYATHWPIIQFGFGLSRQLPIDPTIQGFAWVGVAIGVAWLLDVLPWTGTRVKSPKPAHAISP